MKLKKNSTQQQTSKVQNGKTECCGGGCNSKCYHYRPLNKWTEPVPPRPATPKAIAKAQFVDKTYVWTGR